MTRYRAEPYRDTDSGRTRWAVLHPDTGCWYFPRRFGQSAAAAMAARMNRGA